MNEKEQILDEIRTLLDEQMVAMRKELTPELVSECDHRRRQIQGLLHRINKSSGKAR